MILVALRRRVERHACLGPLPQAYQGSRYPADVGWMIIDLFISIALFVLVLADYTSRSAQSFVECPIRHQRVAGGELREK